MAQKSSLKKQLDKDDQAWSAVTWSDRIVAEAEEMDAIEIYISQTLTQKTDILQNLAGEGGIDHEIHKIDQHMSKSLGQSEQCYA